MGADERSSSGDARRARGWEPYLVPYAAFLLIASVGAWLPERFAGLVLALQVGVPAVLFVAYAARGCFPELRGMPLSPGGLLADVALGLAVAALWVAPYALGVLGHPGPETGFDPDALGPGWADAGRVLRLVGFVAVTPFVEELFVRSFLLRGAELVSLRGGRIEIDESRDFRDLPMARYTAWSFWITVLYFGVSHQPWEWPVAFATGAIYNLWLYRRGHIGSCVLAHAVTNAAIYVLVMGPWGQGLEYFL